MNRLSWLALACVSFFLSACGGGGGGGGTAPPPPTVPTVAIAFVSGSVSPAQNAVSVSPQATLSVEFNVVGSEVSPSATTSLTCSGSTQVSFSTTMTAVALPQGSTGKQWKASAVPATPYPLGLPCSGQMRVTVGDVTEAQSFAFTVNSVFAYTDKVYAIWTFAYPYAVTKTGVKPVTNKTSYTAGNNPVFNCGIANKPLADGKVLLDCQERVTLQARKFYIDPTKDEMYDYAGTVPTDVTFTFVANNSDKPEWSAKAKVSDGWYFTTFDATWVLKFQFDQGGAIIIVKTGIPQVDGNINVLASFSH